MRYALPKRSDDGFGARTTCGVRMNALASSQAPHHSSPCKHADSFALLLVLSKPKHRFGFGRRNGGAAVELSGLPGKRNGASPFGRYPLLHSSFPGRRSSLRPGDAGVRYAPRRANRLRRQNERARVLASPTESSVAIPEDQEEGGSRQGELPRSGKRGWSGPCAVFALAAETERSERLLTPPPCKHADAGCVSHRAPYHAPWEDIA